jgi:hypothetical protein
MAYAAARERRKIAPMLRIWRVARRLLAALVAPRRRLLFSTSPTIRFSDFGGKGGVVIRRFALGQGRLAATCPSGRPTTCLPQPGARAAVCSSRRLRPPAAETPPRAAWRAPGGILSREATARWRCRASITAGWKGGAPDTGSQGLRGQRHEGRARRGRHLGLGAL